MDSHVPFQGFSKRNSEQVDYVHGSQTYHERNECLIVLPEFIEKRNQNIPLIMLFTYNLSKTIVRKETISMILILCTLISPVAALAQKQNSAPDNKDVVNRISKEIGLNDTQKSKVEAILDNEKKKVEAVFNEERKKLQQIQDQTRISLKAVLTPEQMEKLDKRMREQSSKNNPQKK